MTLCFLGLGSNLQSPERQLRKAIVQLHKLPLSVVTSVSSLYVSKALGVRSQPQYRNMVLAVHTYLPAKRLLSYCQRIENKHHRLRKIRWGARTLDIDLLLYGNQTITNSQLTVPHPQMLQRDFVLIPLLEISPGTCFPSGEPIASYVKGCKMHLIP